VKSRKPKAETMVKRQEPRDTRALVRMPAACSRLSRSNPISAPRNTARPSRRSMIRNEYISLFPVLNASHHLGGACCLSPSIAWLRFAFARECNSSFLHYDTSTSIGEEKLHKFCRVALASLVTSVCCLSHLSHLSHLFHLFRF
jgi:hypothetical protein